MTEINASDDSSDEDEVITFEEEAQQIIQLGALPKKSAEQYQSTYKNFKKWQSENKNSLSNSYESNLIVYFDQLKQKLKPPSLWSIWSMLRSTINTYENVDITTFFKLKTLIKNNNKNYEPQKSFTLRWNEIMKFMLEAPDDVYLAAKVILIFGVCGALRCQESVNLKVNDIEDLGNERYLVRIYNNKNDYSGQFLIGSLFYNKVKQYIQLRPTGDFSERFFVQYSKGKCTRQPIGKHNIANVPKTIALYLNLENPSRYTGHCFRRTSATLLSESGGTMQAIKQLGRWRSDMIAQGYIENSLYNKQLIFNGITHEATKINSSSNSTVTKETTSTIPRPSTSTETSNIYLEPTTSKINMNLNLESTTNKKTDNNSNPSTNKTITTTTKNTNLTNNNLNLETDLTDYNLNDYDFSEDFTINKSNQISNEEKNMFITASNKRILESKSTNITHEAKPLISNMKYYNKPPIECNFKRPEVKNNKRKVMEDDLNNENAQYNETAQTLPQHDAKFQNCTLINCNFNYTLCTCRNTNKENQS